MRLLTLLAPFSLLAATLPAAQPAAKADASKAQKLVQVSTLNTIEANREFQANVQLLQAQRQAAVELDTAIGREKDPAKQKELKSRLDALMAKLNENNALMRKTYGFSLDRNYSVVIEKAHVYMFVTEEEAAQLEQAAKKK
jgi:hypothetical protein